MKHFNSLNKILIISLVWTVFFFGVAGYSIGKVKTSDPDVFKKFANKFDIQYSDSGVYISGFPSYESTTAESFAVPENKIVVSLLSGDIKVKRTRGPEVVVRTKSNRMTKKPLTTESSKTDLILYQQDSTSELDIEIEIPDTFKQTIELSTMSGDIEAQHISANNLILKSESGEVEIQDTTAKSTSIEIVSGDISVKNSTVEKIVGKTISDKLPHQ